MYRIIVSFILLFSLSVQANAQTDKRQQIRDAVAALSQPDSLLTPQMKELKVKVGKLAFDAVQVVDNQLKVVVSRAEVAANGIPEIYYDALEQNVGEVNAWVKKSGLDLKQMWEIARQQYRGMFENTK